MIVLVACALGVAALFACGDDELCDTECVGGRLQQICCKTGEECADIAAFCDLGNGLCTDGDCTPGSDAASDTNTGDANRTCGSSTCNPGEICVETMTSGGACELPVDGGLCADGQPPSGGCCDSSGRTFACKPLPGTCGGGVLTCDCASSLCSCGMCEVFSATVLSCTCLAP